MTPTFYDINKFPAEEGLIIFPISMSRIGNARQSAETYWKYINHFNPSKILKTSENSKVGAIFVYGDFLYLHSDEAASILKRRFMNQVASHKNSFMNILRKDPHIILESFSFRVWNQFYLENEDLVSKYIPRIRELYENDNLLQGYIREDFDNMGHPSRVLDENQIDFFLEEHLLFYLMTAGLIRLDNRFIRGHEKWILTAYPGRPLKAHIYLHQLDPFKIKNTKNKYQDSWYDLDEKILYNFLDIDLETYDYKNLQ